MHDFDQLPGASASVIADAASGDLAWRSANFRLFRLLAFVAIAALLWVALALPAWLGRFGIAVDGNALLAPTLVIAIAGIWIAAWKHRKSQARARLAVLTAQQHRARDAVEALRASLPADCSMLGQNLASVSARMLKVYATGDAQLALALSTMLLEVLASPAFASLGSACPPVRARLDTLRAALCALV
ncbi:hypothetical protein F2P44_16540 [Massilia sp. CCM 8695]|uniref:Uncharacterized protein n=1 Tax=Massilia frigida TaxID=2609281 RepID=A0ABX0NG47_9BURK|nr:hypothetical protein [Massilia frigida]NHZ80870.1 hypothetical protein [Massilia frigida]